MSNDDASYTSEYYSLVFNMWLWTNIDMGRNLRCAEEWVEYWTKHFRIRLYKDGRLIREYAVQHGIDT